MSVPSYQKPQLKEIFDEFISDNGNVRPEKLGKLVGKLGLPCTHRSMVQVQAGLRYLNNGDSVFDPEGPGIDFPLFWKWYKLETTPGVYENNNELLVRRVIQHPKLPTRNLKEGAFIYGQKNIADKEGAGEVLLNWVVGERSKSKEAGVSLIKVNKEAVKQKYTTPKQLSRFLREHMNDKNLQRPKVVGKKKEYRPVKSVSMEQLAAAEPTQITRPPKGDDFNEILFPARLDARMGRKEKPYVDTSGQRAKGKLPFPRQTKCSMLLQGNSRKTKELQQQEADRTLWKMKKFSKSKGRVTETLRKNKERIEAAANVSSSA